MVAFLEKHFEFTTPLSIEECTMRLKAKSKRGTGWLASKRDILVHVYDDVNGKKFDLDRDVGKGLYAEVQGQLQRNANGSVRVKGFGRIPLSLFLFTCWFFVWGCIIAYASRNIPPMNIFFFVAGLLPLIFLMLTIRNRNSLITIVYQTLDTRNDH